MQALLMRRQLVEQLYSSQLPQRFCDIRRPQIGHAFQDRQRNLTTDDGRTLQDLLGELLEPIDTRGEHCFNRRRQRNRIDTPREAVGSALALEIAALDQRMDELFDEEGIALCTLG